MTTHAAFALVPLAFLAVPTCCAQEAWREAVEALDRRVDGWRARLDDGDVEAGARIDGILSRRYLGQRGAPRETAYELATFSFEHGAREGQEVRNDWDILFGNGVDGIGVRMVTDDASLIWDLGGGGDDEDRLPDAGPPFEVAAVAGHTYLVHTLDSESNLWARFRILEMEAGRWIVFRWERLADPSKVWDIERRADRLLRSGDVHLQLRCGAVGGNPVRIFSSGKYDACVDRIDADELDMGGPIDIHERSRGHCRGGGYVPDGKVWVVREIRYSGLVGSDSNGHGSFVLQVGGTRIARRESGSGAFRDSWRGRIEVRPGEEDGVFVEISNSSRCDVEFRGELVDAQALPREK